MPGEFWSPGGALICLSPEINIPQIHLAAHCTVGQKSTAKPQWWHTCKKAATP